MRNTSSFINGPSSFLSSSIGRHIGRKHLLGVLGPAYLVVAELAALIRRRIEAGVVRAGAGFERGVRRRRRLAFLAGGLLCVGCLLIALHLYSLARDDRRSTSRAAAERSTQRRKVKESECLQ